MVIGLVVELDVMQAAVLRAGIMAWIMNEGGTTFAAEG